jgi:hypothetical protein
VCECRPRIASNARASSGREEGGGEKTAVDLYMTLGPLPARLTHNQAAWQLDLRSLPVLGVDELGPILSLLGINWLV